MSNHFRIRLRLGPDDAFDIVVKPFDELTTADHIRIYESEAKDEGYNELDRTKNRLVRITGAPDRFIRFMRQHEVEELVRVINEQTAAQDRTLGTLAKVYETLNNWEKEHNGKAWTLDDARAVLEDHSLFTTTIEVNGRTYTAPLVEEATFGQWIDLQSAMDVPGGEAESTSYVRALAVMMKAQDGPYPVQANEESDEAYRDRANAYTQQRRNDFMAAPFVKALGASAFFFSNSERFAAICAHNMSRLRSLTRHGAEPVRRVIPIDGDPTQS